jgi:hypothetical protein
LSGFVADELHRERPLETRIYQIFYDEQTRSAVDPAFEPLDNSGNERPDWYEYWPMLRFLRNNHLDESVRYGFFSPRFSAKTRLAGVQVLSFAAAADADVVTFSPFPEHGACFLNVFEQGEFFAPGLMEVAAEFFAEDGFDIRSDAFVTHSGNIVFANYFVARPRFWRRWAAIVDRCFARAEQGTDRLADLLRSPTTYRGRVEPHFKIFALERLPSLLLAATDEFSVSAYPPFLLPFGRPALRLFLREIIELDELKRSIARTSDKGYLDRYRALQQQVLGWIQWRSGRADLQQAR